MIKNGVEVKYTPFKITVGKEGKRVTKQTRKKWLNDKPGWFRYLMNARAGPGRHKKYMYRVRKDEV